jgi:hypothetical protein
VGSSIEIGFTGDQNMITINDQGSGSPAVASLQLSDGEFLSSADLSLLIQQMTTFAADNGISLNNVNDVKGNADLMNMVAGAWQQPH